MTIEYCAVSTTNMSRLNASKTFRETDKTQMPVRVVNLFPSITNIYKKAQNLTYDYGTGKIIEEITYTDDDSYDDNLPDGILKSKFTVQVNNGVNRFTKFVDLNDLREKLTTSDNKTLTTVTITNEAVSSTCFGVNHGRNYLESSTADFVALLLSVLPAVTDFYVTNDQYTIDLSNGTTSRVISYVIPIA